MQEHALAEGEDESYAVVFVGVNATGYDSQNHLYCICKVKRVKVKSVSVLNRKTYMFHSKWI